MKVAISGTRGRIGSCLVTGLDLDIVELNRPKYNMMVKNTFSDSIEGCDAFIHMAWNTEAGDTKIKDNPNLEMIRNVCDACIEKEIPKVIIASSVHVQYLPNYYGKDKINISTPTTPAGNYGDLKVELEELSKSYSTKGLNVVVIRFGGLYYEDIMEKEDPIENAVFLSCNDCCNLIKKILVEEFNESYVLMYAVSNNKERFHSYKNPFGWIPQDSR